MSSRLQCEELCLRERGFVCRSGEYDYAFQQCKLSSEDRRSQPSSFRPAFGDIDYFENQCVPGKGHWEAFFFCDASRYMSSTVFLLYLFKFPSPDGSTGCDYEEKPDTDVERADALLTTSSQSECQQQCDGTQSFLCHAYSFRMSSSACKLSSDDTYNLGSNAIRRRIGSSYFQRSNCLDRKFDFMVINSSVLT